MVLSLITQRVGIVSLFYRNRFNIWNAFMLVLIFLGGLLIIFIYLSALTPNEFFKIKKKHFLTRIILTWVFFFIPTINISSKRERWTTPKQFGALFIPNLILVILIYLLLTLFSVLYLCSKHKTPAKNNSYGIPENTTPCQSYKLIISRSSSPF